MTRHHRIVLSYPFGGPAREFGRSCVRALKNLGHDVTPFDSSWKSAFPSFRRIFKTEKRIHISSQANLSKTFDAVAKDLNQLRFEQLVAEKKPSVLLLIRGDYHDRDFIRYLKRQYHIPWIAGWWIEGPKWLDAMFADAEMCDVYYCIHTHGYENGKGITHLPALAIDRSLYRMNASITRDKEICFVGTWHKRRQEYLSTLTNWKLSIYGPGWMRRNFTSLAMLRAIKGSHIFGNRLAELYSSTQIGVDIPSWSMSGALTLRILEIPACGALLLAQADPMIFDHFSNDQVDVFTSKEELASKARFYLENSAVRERMARAAYEQTLILPTFEDRMREILRPMSH